MIGVTMRKVSSSARMDATKRYRYRLDRWWGPESATRLPFIMLNPSTADASRDDPTIRRCMGFARREGYFGITVVNLGAYRATDPAEWAAAADPFGPDNLATVVAVAESAGLVVAAWGAHPHARVSARDVLGRLADLGVAVMCLGVTKDGSPRHPLYVRSDQPLSSFQISNRLL